MVVFPLNKRNTLAGFQWFFFIFCNTVVVPPTLQSAFQLPASALITLTQYGFITTGLACLAQALLGHRRAIMEGPTGLWWSTILTVTVGEAARGTPFASIASSLAVGISLSAIFTIIIGVSGIGHRLAKLFSPTVMVFFMLLLGAQLTTIFFKGMLGLPFSSTQANVGVQLAPFSLALAVMLLVLGMIIFLPDGIARYALLFGTLVGWAGWYLLFRTPPATMASGPIHWQWFPLGYGGELRPGIILTALLAGLVNITNTYGAIRGSDVFYPQQGASNTRYRRSFIISGLMTLITVPLSVVPFIIGCLCCLLVGLFTPLTHFFTTLPLPISSAVMLVSYLPLLYSSLSFSKQITFTARNIYRLALPLFIGIFLMGLPPVYLQTLPLTIRPLLGNGLLIGVLLAVVMENLIPWDRIK